MQSPLYGKDLNALSLQTSLKALENTTQRGSMNL